MPAGSVSSTVVVPEVGAEPEFATWIVHVPVVATAKLPACVLVIERLGVRVGRTTVGSEARSFVGSVSPNAITMRSFVFFAVYTGVMSMAAAVALD